MNHVDFHKIRVTSCLHGMYMSRISSQEMEETKPDGFDVTSTNVHMDLLQREVGVFDEMSWRLHLTPDAGDETSGHLWQQNWVFFWEDVRTFSGCICAGKNATRRSIYRPVYGDKTRYLWWDGKPLQMYLLPTEPDAFHETSGQFQTCSLARWENLALSRLKIEDWTLTNIQNCDIKERKVSKYLLFAELCIANTYLVDMQTSENNPKKSEV